MTDASESVAHGAEAVSHHEVVAEAVRRFHQPLSDDGHLAARHNGAWGDSLALTHCLCYGAAWRMLDHLLDHPDQFDALRRGQTPPFPTQAQVLAWVAERWPGRTDPIWRAAKLCEEAGEVIGAVIKMDEGRKTAADVEMETAQTVICAMGVAESVGFDLWAAVAEHGPTHRATTSAASPDSGSFQDQGA